MHRALILMHVLSDCRGSRRCACSASTSATSRQPRRCARAVLSPQQCCSHAMHAARRRPRVERSCLITHAWAVQFVICTAGLFVFLLLNGHLEVQSACARACTQHTRARTYAHTHTCVHTRMHAHMRARTHNPLFRTPVYTHGPYTWPCAPEKWPKPHFHSGTPSPARLGCHR